MSGPVMANGQPRSTGTGRYCPPRICWCGSCAWWRPIPEPNYSRYRKDSGAVVQRRSWEQRQESTWIDEL